MNRDEILTAEVLSPEQNACWEEAEICREKILKAAGVANFNGWTTGIIALLSIPFAFYNYWGPLITLVLAIVAYNELRWRRSLLKFEPIAASLLGWNQIGFLAMILLYCLSQLYSGLSNPQHFTEQLADYPEYRMIFEDLAEGDLNQVFRWLVLAIYIPVMGLSLIFQGWNALYYFSRRKLVTAYLQAMKP